MPELDEVIASAIIVWVTLFQPGSPATTFGTVAPSDTKKGKKVALL
jgi:hypothetical protein